MSMKTAFAVLIGTLLLVSLLSAQGGTQGGSVADRAYNNGYQAGFKLGKADGKSGKPEDFQESSVYRRATDGWKEETGDFETYRTNFKAGYADGYKDGHKEGRGGGSSAPAPAAAPRPLYPPPATLPALTPAAAADEAFSNGYREGYPKGKSDEAGPPRATETAAYRDANHGYDPSRFPAFDDYQLNFRQGYEAGYSDGHTGRASNPRRDAMRAVQPRNDGRNDGRLMHPTTPAPAAAAPAPTPAPAPTTTTISDGTILRLRLENTISTRTSRQGDRFTATVTEPIYVPGSSEIAIPIGTKVAGVVTQVERPGRVKGTAQLHMRYETLTPPGGPEYPLQATTSGLQDKNKAKVDEGEGSVKGPKSTGRDTAEVAGGGALGAIIGGIAGGGKGAGIGAAIGAGAGLGGVLMQRGKEIDLPSGTSMEIRLMHSLDIKK